MAIMLSKFKFVLVGRPNVGKSTLFNCLTGRQTALTSETAGLTRDEEQAALKLSDDVIVTLSDLGGIDPFHRASCSDPVINALTDRAWRSARACDRILLVVDFKTGLTQKDYFIADQLRRTGLKVTLVINKCDTAGDASVSTADFFGLGFPLIAVSAAHRRGIEELRAHLLEQALLSSRVKGITDQSASAKADGPVDSGSRDKTLSKIAIIGRPNVGKSSLVNTCLGFDRMIVSAVPGTTLQPIATTWNSKRRPYSLVDTAGLRQRSRISQKLEKISAIKTVETVEEAEVIWLVWDMLEPATQQDLQLLRLALSKGKKVIIVLNKIDQLSPAQQKQALEQAEHKIRFAAFVPIVCISAQMKRGLGALRQMTTRLLQQGKATFSTARLNKILALAKEQLPEPMSGPRRIRLKFICQSSDAPMTFSIYGNQTTKIPQSYERYLINYFRNALALKHLPLRLKFIQSENPFIKG